MSRHVRPEIAELRRRARVRSVLVLYACFVPFSLMFGAIFSVSVVMIGGWPEFSAIAALELASVAGVAGAVVLVPTYITIATLLNFSLLPSRPRRWGVSGWTWGLGFAPCIAFVIVLAIVSTRLPSWVEVSLGVAAHTVPVAISISCVAWFGRYPRILAWTLPGIGATAVLMALYLVQVQAAVEARIYHVGDFAARSTSAMVLLHVGIIVGLSRWILQRHQLMVQVLPQAGYCPGCRYHMGEITELRCPECGLLVFEAEPEGR